MQEQAQGEEELLGRGHVHRDVELQEEGRIGARGDYGPSGLAGR